jgi:hypothetical protein
MMTCAEFAEILGRAAVKAQTGLVVPTEELMEDVQNKAKEAIGTYAYGWPQLAEATQESRVNLGFSANDPLLRTGALQADVSERAETSGMGAEGVVYSNMKEGLWAELGTSRGEPPRSFLMQSLIRSYPKMGELFAAFAESLFR